MTVHHYCQTGRYNLCSSDRQTQVVLATPAGNVSELWPEGEAPYDSEMAPSGILDAIEERLNSYLFTSKKAESTARIAAIRARIDEFDAAWYRNQFKRYAAKAEKYLKLAEQAEEHVKEN